MSYLHSKTRPKNPVIQYDTLGPAALQSLGWQDGQPILRPLPSRSFRGEIPAAFARRGAAIQRQSQSVSYSTSIWQATVTDPDAQSNEDIKFHHVPVMAREIVDLFAQVPAGWIVDATLGGAGHAQQILEAHPHLRIFGFDQDPTAVAIASNRLARYGQRAQVVHARFDEIAAVLMRNGIDSISGALFDLGVSSYQFDQPERGFSYRFDAPLDMRMNPAAGLSAHQVVNEYDPKTLERVIREYSDEKFAHKIVRAIIAARPITTTAQLSAVIASAIPAPARRRGGNPAKRTFQAIRIEVNSELQVLPDALEQAISSLTVGGRIAVLAYHSGEDRIVKAVLRNAETGGCTCPPRLPCGCGAIPTLKKLRVAAKPSPAEVASNPRAASAKFRAAEKIAFTEADIASGAL